MKAPSEKHLEDWIVANPEKFGVLGDYRYFSLAEFIIKRQSRLPHGIPDLIVKSPYHSITVVELKRDSINSDTVAQCLRYMCDLQGIFAMATVVASQDRGIEYSRDATFDVGELREISGVVVGDSMPDRNLIAVCNMANIAPVIYEFDGENYTFTFAGFQIYNLMDLCSQYLDWANGSLGGAMIALMQERIQDEAMRKAARHD